MNKNNNKPVPALDMLERTVRIAEAIVESGRAYMEMMADTPRVKVVVGGFYRTFDGSLAYVARVAEPAPPTCDECGKVRLAITPHGIRPATPEEAPAHDAAAPEAAGEEPPVVEEVKPHYVVTILRGGHGIKDVRGEEPGDPYEVDHEGMILTGRLSTIATSGEDDPNDQKTLITKLGLSLVGLSLREQIDPMVLR